jgi:predicted ATPase/pimeloyl-ACP methyl ester carboxylesterase/DNA-binding SARP family transcriptional activator
MVVELHSPQVKLAARTDPVSLQIQVLGELTVLLDGEIASLPPSKKTRALLAYLATVQRPQRRERLCEMFWEVPDDPRGALRWSLSKIRQILHADGENRLQADRNVVSLETRGVVFDMEPFHGLAAREVEGLDTERLEDLANRFRGRFLEDLSLPRCPEYEAWRVAMTDELELLRLQILRTLLARLADQPGRVLPHARALQLLLPEDQDLAREVRRLSEAARVTTVSVSGATTSGPEQQAFVQAAPAVAAADAPLPADSPEPLRQEIRHCRAPDGARLAYATSGAGLPIVRAAHWLSHLEYDWNSPVWRHWIDALSRKNLFIRYDERGNGLSEWNVEDLSFEAMVSDLAAIIDASGLRRVFLLGLSQGAAVSIAYAIRHPERVAGLILYGGFAKGWRKRGDPREIVRREAMNALMRDGWGQRDPIFRQMFTSLFIPGATPEQMEFFNELQRITASPENAVRLFEEFGEIDVSDLLPKLRVPTLVMHADNDAVIPIAAGRQLAEEIRGARFVELHSANHILLAHEPAFQVFVDECRSFIADPEQTRDLVGPPPPVGIDQSRQQVTVLAAEVVSPLQAFEMIDPEAAMSELQPIYDQLLKTIGTHDGVVTAQADGALTAVFGLSRVTEDHAFLACRAALDATRAISQMSQGKARLRAGIDTGEVIVKQRWNGETSTVELSGTAPRASNRLVRALRRSTVGLTARARAAAGGYVRTQRMMRSDHPYLGRDESIYELLGESKALSRWHLRSNKGLTELIGRESEMQSLQTAWRRVREGHGQVVGVVADPGFGKSRLAHEFLASESVAGFTVLEAGAFEFDSSVAFGVIRKLMGAACGHLEGGGAKVARERMQRKCSELNLDPRLVPPLCFAAGWPVEDEAWSRLDALQRKQAVCESVRAFVVAMSRIAPVAILIEDLHWVDSECVEMLNRLVETIGGARILLIATYRPEFSHSWAMRGHYQQIRLERFGPEDVSTFLNILLGPDPSVADLGRRLAERAEGTPLFLEEIVRGLVESGKLRGSPGRYVAPQPIDSLQIPSNIQSLIATRIRRLPDIQRSLLQVASVIGKDVPGPLLRGLSHLQEAEFNDALAQLQAHEFLFEVQSFPEMEYTFKHMLTRAVAYDSLLAEDRRELHRRALRAIERIHGDALDNQIEALAEHATRAEDWDAAATYLFRAAARAEERSAYRIAAEFLENARRAVDRLPRTPENIARAIDLRTRMRPVYDAAGDYRKAAAPLAEARLLADELGDAQRLYEVLIHQSYLNSSHGRFEEALEPANTMKELALAAGVYRCASEADLAAAQALMLRSRASEAIERLLPHRENFTGPWRHERYGNMGVRAVWYLGHLAQAMARVGRFREADAAVAELRSIADESERPLDICAAAFFAGVVGLLRGPDRDLLAHLREMSSETGIGASLLVRPWVMTMLGHVEFVFGNSQSACRTLESAISEAERLDLPQFECRARAVLAWARLRCGEPEAAANLDHALALARGRQDPWSEVIALRGLAERDGERGGIGRLTKACEVAEAAGLKPELARSLLALSRAQQQANLDDARASASRADALFAEMGIARDVGEAEADADSRAA